jgi:AcrR family transcriptional regulator
MPDFPRGGRFLNKLDTEAPDSIKDAGASALAMRERLMDACILSIQRKGLVKTSIRDIADAAGIARQTVYKHFSNKNAILAATFQREGLAFANQVAGAIAPIADVGEQFIEGFVYVVENFTRNPILAELVTPGSTFLIDAGMKYFSFAEFGMVVFHGVFAAWPQLAEDAEAISELWTRNALSFIAMPGPQRDSDALRSFVRRHLVPGLGLGRIQVQRNLFR